MKRKQLLFDWVFGFAVNPNSSSNTSVIPRDEFKTLLARQKQLVDEAKPMDFRGATYMGQPVTPEEVEFILEAERSGAPSKEIWDVVQTHRKLKEAEAAASAIILGEPPITRDNPNYVLSSPYPSWSDMLIRQGVELMRQETLSIEIRPPLPAENITLNFNVTEDGAQLPEVNENTQDRPGV
jgi:hypothetical protein